MPIVWPKPTHGDPKSEAVISGKLKPWRTAAECIDWSIPCKSIFERKKPLAENTLRRIARGIQKFVIDNPNPFVINYKFNNEPENVDRPLSTVTSVNGHCLVTPYIARIGQTGFGSDKMQYDIEKPLTTVVTKAEHLLVTPTLIQMGYGDPEGRRALDLDKPLGTVTAGGNKFALATALIARQFGKSIGSSMDDPLGTVTAGGGGKSQLVTAFIAKHYGGNYTGAGAGLDEPLPTVTTVDHNALVTSHLVKMKGTNIGQQVTEPIQTITAGGLHFGEVRSFLIKYNSTAIGQEISEPMHTVTTKDRLGLVSIHGQDYQIVDICMRMLKPRELFRGQGFDDDYIIDRDSEGNKFSQEDQVARCGNAVPPPFSKSLVRANLPELCVSQDQKEKRYARG